MRVLLIRLLIHRPADAARRLRQWHRRRAAATLRQLADAGASTAEYAMTMLAACAFAGILMAIIQSSAVKGLLLGIIQKALHL